MNNIVPPTYQVSTYVSDRRTQATLGVLYASREKLHRVHTLGSIRVGPDNLVVIFDVAPLFIRLPLMESLELPSRFFGEELLILFKHVLTSRYFSFDGQFYEQTDGWQWVLRSLPSSLPSSRKTSRRQP